MNIPAECGDKSTLTAFTNCLETADSPQILQAILTADFTLALSALALLAVWKQGGWPSGKARLIVVPLIAAGLFVLFTLGFIDDLADWEYAKAGAVVLGAILVILNMVFLLLVVDRDSPKGGRSEQDVDNGQSSSGCDSQDGAEVDPGGADETLTDSGSLALAEMKVDTVAIKNVQLSQASDPPGTDPSLILAAAIAAGVAATVASFLGRRHG